MHKALYYQPLEGNKVHCHLCPHNCIIADGAVGICRQRKNIEGVLYSMNYGQVASINIDPMEKKPLYHFYPGQKILSIGTNGCNLGCQFCQNWSISQEDSQTNELVPDEIIKMASQYGTRFIAYTYNEPFIWYEYVLDVAKLAKEKGLMNVLVTNGYVNPEPLIELLPYISAMNIDIKSIKGDFYRRLCKAKLEPVLETAKISREKKVHVEITNLVIPQENDNPGEFEELARWIADNLGKETPLHLSSYFPSYKLKRPPTPLKTLITAYKIAKKYLYFVYLGNVGGIDEGNDTICYKCGNKLVERRGYEVKIISGTLTSDGRCKNCGNNNNLVTAV
jgi:pyruvate formate lyase activating enzyme